MDFLVWANESTFMQKQSRERLAVYMALLIFKIIKVDLGEIQPINAETIGKYALTDLFQKTMIPYFLLANAD